jgi:hypothetical protein
VKERLILNRCGVKVYRRHFQHSPEIGHSDHIALDAGRVHLDFERAVGIFGFRDTVSYAVRGYVDRRSA